MTAALQTELAQKFHLRVEELEIKASDEQLAVLRAADERAVVAAAAAAVEHKALVKASTPYKRRL